MSDRQFMDKVDSWLLYGMVPYYTVDTTCQGYGYKLMASQGIKHMSAVSPFQSQIPMGSSSIACFPIVSHNL